MRVLIFHGYLLSGTGSNVYNARLAEALVRLGHEVHLLSQDRHAERQPFVDAVGEWDEGALRVRTLREPPRCTVYRPNIGNLLPVYVPDRYEGIQARSFLECSDAQLAAYVEANVAAVREVLERVNPDAALANHLVMGPMILAHALAGAVPYAVKVHGSALEYTVKRDPGRFLTYAREGLAQAEAVLVGSRHTAQSLWQALADPTLQRRTRMGPPGVDVERFSPRAFGEAHTGLEQLTRRLRAHADQQAPTAPDSAAEPVSAFTRDELQAAAAIERLGDQPGPLVAFVGKLIVSKGVDLLLAAWPLVLQAVPSATLAVIGFGAYRKALLELLGALATGDLRAARQIALAGRSREADPADTQCGGSGAPLRHLIAFLDSLSGSERERYLAAAAALGERVTFTGRLDHDELAEVLPACQALVVPSTFPEAFGMVAAEAAACGVLPVSARHSGLAEVSDVLARKLPQQAASWLSFPVDDGAVWAIASRLISWLQAESQLRAQVREQLVRVARERWSWEGVARGVIDAAQGRLDMLDLPR